MTQEIKRCFAIMPFDPSFDEIYEHAIYAVAEEQGYFCHRCDQTVGAVNLIQSMIHHIHDADLCIADLSGGNVNVFYELGVAHCSAERNKTIMITERETAIPFDIGPYHVVQYERGYAGITRLRESLTEQILFLEERGQLASNPVQDYREKLGQGYPAELLNNPRTKASSGLADKLSARLLQVGLLEHLAALPVDAPAPNLTSLCRALEIRSRKSAHEAVRELESEGLIERANGSRAAWKLTEQGSKALARLRSVASLRVGP